MMYAAMPQCQNVILGGSHDNGYPRILSTLETANIPPGKVILLQSPMLAPELERIDSFLFPRIKLRDIFLERRLDVGKRYAQVAADGNLPTLSKSTTPPRPSTQRLVEPDLSMLYLIPFNSRRMAIS
jgi:hypothetical protein